MLVLRGVLAILFAICAFIWPGLTLGVLVLLWGAFAVVDGVVAIASGISARWSTLAGYGVLGVAAGSLAGPFPCRLRADHGRMESPLAIHRPCESALPF